MSIKTNYLKSIGSYFHVYNRGVNRNPIFIEPRNYDYFLQRARKSEREYNIKIIAYCLMPNHFHFLLYQVSESGIAQFVKSVCDGYVKAINKAYGKSGHLFEGKYKIKIVNDEQYLVHLSRYIHLNPVEAQLEHHPEEWQYSSFGEYIGSENRNIVSPEVILKEFKDTAGYIDFVKGYKRNEISKIEGYLFDE